jgi:predicted nucleic acid-binding protein
MIAADTSTWIAYLQGNRGEDVDLLDRALLDRQLLMVPVVLTELLSDPGLAPAVARSLSDVPRIESGPDYWEQAGFLRASVLSRRRKARLGDALIAQTCLARDISLVTRDRDFRAFAESANPRLVLLP